MFDFEFEHIERCEVINLEESDQPCLWILHADKIPPHVGLSFRDKYYSLKSNGKDQGVKLSGLVALIRQKRIATIRVTLNTEIRIKEMDEIFAEYEFTLPGKISCLQPIRSILHANEASKLSELLCILQARNEIGPVRGYFVRPELKGVLSYQISDIHKRLEGLADERY